MVTLRAPTALGVADAAPSFDEPATRRRLGGREWQAQALRLAAQNEEGVEDGNEAAARLVRRGGLRQVEPGPDAEGYVYFLDR